MPHARAGGCLSIPSAQLYALGFRAQRVKIPATRVARSPRTLAAERDSFKLLNTKLDVKSTPAPRAATFEYGRRMRVWDEQMQAA